MINYLWGLFIVIGIIYSFFTGNTEGINLEIINSISIAVELILKIIPLMCLWLGLMNIAKVSGLLSLISKKISPIIGILFPEISRNSEALSIISLTIIMNMLGLGNAATPMGLKAMKEMQKLNNNKDMASRSMITFLVINTSSVTIIPTTVISLRILYGASNPTDIVLACIITSFLSCILGLIIDRLFYYIRGNKYEFNI